MVRPGKHVFLLSLTLSGSDDSSLWFFLGGDPRCFTGHGERLACMSWLNLWHLRWTHGLNSLYGARAFTFVSFWFWMRPDWTFLSSPWPFHANFIVFFSLVFGIPPTWYMFRYLAPYSRRLPAVLGQSEMHVWRDGNVTTLQVGWCH